MAAGKDERRRFARHPIQVPLRFRLVQGESEVRAHVGDLGNGGLSFESESPLPLGTALEVTFPVEDQQFHFAGSVAHCHAEPDGERFRIGIVFGSPTLAFQMKLAEQVMRIEDLRRELSRLRGVSVSSEEAAREWVEHYAEEFAELYK